MNPVIGPTAFKNFEETGLIPTWLDVQVMEELRKLKALDPPPPRKAQDLLGGTESRNGVRTPPPVHVMGMSKGDMHDLDFDD